MEFILPVSFFTRFIAWALRVSVVRTRLGKRGGERGGEAAMAPKFENC